MQTKEQKINNILEQAVKCGVNVRAEHIEQMAAAYSLKTDIDPQDVILVEIRGTHETKWYFRRRLYSEEENLNDVATD